MTTADIGVLDATELATAAKGLADRLEAFGVSVSYSSDAATYRKFSGAGLRICTSSSDFADSCAKLPPVLAALIRAHASLVPLIISISGI